MRCGEKGIRFQRIRVAAIALQNGLTLVTYEAHFRQVKSLTTEAW